MAEAYQPSMRDETVEKKTGKNWQTWFHLLDEWDAKTQGHKETARHLSDTHGVPGWWAQTITVEYERARGLREVGQTQDGDHEFSVQRTVNVPPQDAAAAWTDPHQRKKWLPADLEATVAHALGEARESETRMGRILRTRVDLEGAQCARMELAFTPIKDKTQVRLVIGALDAKKRQRLKPKWTVVMDAYRDAVRP